MSDEATKVGKDRSGLTLAGGVSAIPDFGLALLFLVTWISPYAFAERTVAKLVLVVLMEFLIIHSSGFMGYVLFGEAGKWRKAVQTIGLALFYTLFVAAFTFSFGQWWPLWAFWGMTLNRLLGILLGQAPTGQEKALVQKSWVVGALMYFFFVFFTVVVPLPTLGITPDVVARQGFTMKGLWVEDPQTALALGFLYYTSVGVSEMFGHSWFKLKYTIPSSIVCLVVPILPKSGALF